MIQPLYGARCQRQNDRMETLPAAYVLNREFPAMARTEFEIDRHYLLYARRGTMRLEHQDHQWSLPPARAALIAANTRVQITLPAPVEACSVLFDATVFPQPPAKLRVFDISALARELILSCRTWSAEAGPQPDLVVTLFQTLGAVTWQLSQSARLPALPLGRSTAVRDALQFTADHLTSPLTFDAVAAAVALTPRTLARRFNTELGQSWGQMLRQMRMMQASELLAHSDDAIVQVALNCGYESISAFNSAFKAYAGMSPTRYRSDMRTRPF